MASWTHTHIWLDDLLEPGAFCKTLSHLLYVRDHHSASPQIPSPPACHSPQVLQKQSEHLHTPLHVLFFTLDPVSTHFCQPIAPSVISLSSARKQANTSFKIFPWSSYSLRYNPLSPLPNFWEGIPTYSLHCLTIQLLHLSLSGFWSYYSPRIFLSVVSGNLLNALSFPSPTAPQLFASSSIADLSFTEILLWASATKHFPGAHACPRPHPQPHPQLLYLSLIYPVKEGVTPNPWLSLSFSTYPFSLGNSMTASLFSQTSEPIFLLPSHNQHLGVPQAPQTQSTSNSDCSKLHSSSYLPNLAPRQGSHCCNGSLWTRLNILKHLWLLPPVFLLLIFKSHEWWTHWDTTLSLLLTATSLD